MSITHPAVGERIEKLITQTVECECKQQLLMVLYRDRLVPAGRRWEALVSDPDGDKLMVRDSGDLLVATWIEFLEVLLAETR